MHLRRLARRVLLALTLAVLTVLAVIGGIGLGGSGTVAVVLAGVVAACLGAGMASETPGRSSHRITVDAAWQTGACTIGALLVVSGIAGLAGATVAAVSAVLAGAAALVAWLVLRSPRRTAPAAPVEFPAEPVPGPPPSAGGSATVRPTVLADWARVLPLPPVSALSTTALGAEWLRTSSALTQPIGPAVRQSLALRRQEALDELERRDPDGFARWLAAGPQPGSDPAGFVHDGPAAA